MVLNRKKTVYRREYKLERYGLRNSTWNGKGNKHLPDGGLSYFNKTQLIDDVIVYWSTNSICTSMRLYAENMSSKNRALYYDKYPSPIPVWFLQAKNEPLYQSPTILKAKYTNIQVTTVLDDGGHFLALEQPSVFADDVFKAVKAFRSHHASESNSEL